LRNKFNPLEFQDFDPVEKRYFTNETKLKSFISKLLKEQEERHTMEIVETIKVWHKKIIHNI
jgi:hypothetical protein